MSRISRTEEVREQVTKTRVPVASNRAPLTVRGFDHENYVGRWVIDLDDRLEIFLAGGWEFVTKPLIKSAGEPTIDSSKGPDTRVTKPAGRGFTLYLMRIPKEFYKEDQVAKQQDIDRTERAMTMPGSPTLDSDVDYGKISIGNRQGKEVLSYKDVEK